MKKLVMVTLFSILFVMSSVGFGLSQTPPEIDLREPTAEVGWAFNSGRIYLNIGVRSGYLKGDTTYRISFPGGASELEFPLKTYLLGPEISWGYKNAQKQDKFLVKLRWLTNIGQGSGKMKDSDWIEGDGQPGLDIYSESDIKLRVNIVDANGIYRFWPMKQLSIGPMMGYRYQQLKYDVKNTDQVGIGIYDLFYTTSVHGKTMEYKVVYYVPYFGLNSDVLFGKKFKVNAGGGYTPWASAKDRDDHILRYKLSKGDTDGYAYFTNLNAIWNFLPHWFLIISGEYMKIRTTGTQHQSFYAGPDVGQTFDVDDKITSKQTFFSTAMTYRF